MGAADLAQVLGRLPFPLDPNLLVGFSTSDDAAVYKLTDELALALTIDVFTPIVDDPYWFGAIAAANALSDVYAMGAKPIALLSFAGFPRDVLPWSVLEEMLRGGAEKAREAGVDVVGGHTVDDAEPKCGYAAIGIVHPDRIATNAGGQDGDVLILTKPLGSGILASALKQDLLSPDEVDQVTRVMATLNKAAAEAMLAVGSHACTDVTGFGLLGHLHEMAKASGLTAVLDTGAVPVMPRVRELAAAGVVPGGSRTNEAFLQSHLSWSEGVDEITRIILADAQTSGGLLIAVSADRRELLLADLEGRGVQGHVIGRLAAGTAGAIRLEA